MRNRREKPEGESARSNRLMAVFLLIVVAVAGVLVIRAQVGPARPVVDVDALERLDEIRATSIEQLTRAEEMIQEGRLDEAFTTIRGVTEQDPNFALGHLMLGYVFLEQGKLPLAAEATRRAHGLDPGDPATNFQLGQIESSMGHLESAIECLARAIRIRTELELPPLPEYHITFADALARNWETERALRQMERALEADRAATLSAVSMAGPAAQMALARVLARRQEMSEAVRFFAQAAHAAPDRPDWQYEAARAYYVQGKFDQAAAYIQRAVDMDPTNPRYVRLKERISQKGYGSDDPLAAPEPAEPNEPNELEIPQVRKLFDP